MSWIAKINRQTAIFDVLYSKQAFLNNENIGFKNPQNWIFPKALVHGFDQKVGNFVNNSFYAKYTQRKVFAEVLVRKQAFLDNIKYGIKKNAKLTFLQSG